MNWIVGLILAGTTSAAFAAEPDVLTVGGGVVCLSPFKLSEGIVASNRGDSNWVKELGCVTLADGHRAIIVRKGSDWASPWQVRLTFENGTAVTGYGFSASFKTLNGKRFKTPLGTPK